VPVHEAADGVSRAGVAARAAVAAAGAVAVVAAYRLTLLAGDERSPRVHAALVAWITLAYVACGLIAWWRRPGSAFGVLMIAAGFSPAVARLAELDDPALHALGEACRLLPPVLFLHVFLAYPTGRLVRRLDRLVVVWAYAAVLGLDVVRAAAAGTVAAQPADAAQRAAVAVVAIACVVAVVSRRRSPGFPIVFFALAATTALYIAIQLVAQGMSGPALAQHTSTPLADAAGRFLGRAGVTLMLVGAVCSMFGYLCGDMLSTPRTLYALARDGFLPKVFSRIRPATHTPAVAIWTHAALVLAFASTNTFQSLAIIGNVGLLILYFLACAAAVELTRRDVRIDGPPFAPAGAWIGPVAGGVLLLLILSTATTPEFAVTAVVLAVATVVYALRASRRPRP
jgi:hypothetical protein